uniref:Odorant receptor n=1 Tax=Chouioia cunea TaxID=1570515 RepID=A0A6B9CKK4_9HYME|nr:odorant receptor 2 [Chouioia cunea]
MGIFSSSDQSGFDVAIGPCRAVLNFLGAWVDPVEPQTTFALFRFFLSTSTMIIFSCLVQTIEVFRGWGDLNYVIEILIIDDIPICVAVMKFIVSFYNKDILKRLVVLMAKDWQSKYADEDWKIMWETAQFSRKLSLVCILLAEGTITAQCMVVLMFDLYSKDKKERPLYMHSYFPFNTQTSPNYEFTWFGQFMCTVYAASAFSSVDAFFGVLVLHLCGQLSVLKRNLKVLTHNDKENLDSDEFTRRIAALVDRHDHLNMFAKTLEDSFNLMFLPQMIGTSLAMCLQGYQLVVISTGSEEGLPLLQIFHMVYFTTCFSFSLFVYCFVAERLQFESTEIDYAAYQSEWYNWAPRDTRLLLLLMGRARKPLEITAGKFCVFSLGLYCSILKTCGGYVSMLLAVRRRLVQNQ